MVGVPRAPYQLLWGASFASGLSEDGFRPLWEFHLTMLARTWSPSRFPSAWPRGATADREGSSGGDTRTTRVSADPPASNSAGGLPACPAPPRPLTSQGAHGGSLRAGWGGGHRVCSSSRPGHCLPRGLLCSGSSCCPVLREPQCPSGSWSPRRHQWGYRRDPGAVTPALDTHSPLPVPGGVPVLLTRISGVPREWPVCPASH